MLTKFLGTKNGKLIVVVIEAFLISSLLDILHRMHSLLYRGFTEYQRYSGIPDVFLTDRIPDNNLLVLLPPRFPTRRPLHGRIQPS